MRALRVAATVASALGFIGAAIEIHWVFNADHGLLRLEAGRVESVGFQRATLSVALGIATSSLALGSFTILRKVALDRLAQCRRLVAAVEDALDSPIDEGIAQASRDRLAPENRVASEPPTADGV
ncbi:MAG: hypothetical protein KF729_21355 [Sandaracinaceae bacterium]|nr:hypothetical protein [Sandaracinaceae bacterium]